MVGCAQPLTPFSPTGSQPTVPNARAIAVKPADSVTAYVTYRNESGGESFFTVYWSYAANPFWHEENEACIRRDGVYKTRVVYNHIKQGPQIKFKATYASGCARKALSVRSVLFRAMNFTPDAHFEATYQPLPNDNWKLCAHGGGQKEVCDDKE